MVIRTLGVLTCAAAFAWPASAQDSALGKQVFENKGNCFTCHGPHALGTPLAPNLRDSVWINIDGSLEQIMRLVKSGVPKPKQHPAPMPPMGGAKLKDAEIEAVARYILSLETLAVTSRRLPTDRCAATARHAARTERPRNHAPAWVTSVAHAPAASPGNPRCGRIRMQ